MNKITKLLSVFIIAGALGASVAGVAGCNKGGGDDDDSGSTPTCQHTQISYEDNQNGTTHKEICDDCSTTINASASHVDANDDGTCDLCFGDVDDQAVITITLTSANKLKVGEDLTLTANATNTTAAITWTITQGEGTYASINGNVLHGIAVGQVKVQASVGGASETFTITVEALSKFDELAGKDGAIVLPLNNDIAKLPAFTSFGTPGMYSSGATDVLYSKVEGGYIKLVTTAAGETNAIIDLGDAANSEVLEGYMEITPKDDVGASWSFFRFLKGTDSPSEILSLRTNSATALQYRLNGAEKPAEKKQGESDVTLTVGSVYKVYFKYNSVGKHLLLTVNNTTIVDNTVDLTGLKGIGLYSGGSNTRTVWANNIVACTSSLGAEDYRALVTAYGERADALKVSGNWTDTATAASLATAATNATIANDATAQAAKTTYEAYVGAVNTALATEYLARLQAAYPADDYSHSEEGTPEADKTAYEKAVIAATAAFGEVTDLADFAGVYTAQDTIFAAIPTAEAENLTKVVIEIYYVGENDADVKIGTINKNSKGGDLVVGDQLTLDAIKEACTPPAGKYIAKLNKGGTAVGATYTAAEADGTVTGEGKDKVSTVKFYAVLGDRTAVSIDSALAAGMTFTPKSTSLEAGTFDTTHLTADGTLTSSGKFVEGSLAIADGITFSCAGGKAKFQSASASDDYSKVINTGGNAQYILLEIDKACTITVKFSATAANDSSKNDRVGAIMAGKGTDQAFPGKAVPGADANLADGTVEAANQLVTISAHVDDAGKYYFTCGGSIDIYEIIIDYDLAA